MGKSKPPSRWSGPSKLRAIASIYEAEAVSCGAVRRSPHGERPNAAVWYPSLTGLSALVLVSYGGFGLVFALV